MIFGCFELFTPLLPSITVDHLDSTGHKAPNISYFKIEISYTHIHIHTLWFNNKNKLLFVHIQALCYKQLL